MIEEIEKNVIDWATERGIAFSANRDKQALKVVEEVGEICDAMLKNRPNEVPKEIGDACVALTILAHQYNTTLLNCINISWDKISTRDGKTIDGSFIKREDL